MKTANIQVYGNISCIEILQYLLHYDTKGSRCTRALWLLNREDTDTCNLTINYSNSGHTVYELLYGISHES